MRVRLLFASLALLAAGLISGAHAQGKGDGGSLVTLDTVDVDLRRGTATIDLSKAKGAYRAIRLQSQRGDVSITNVQVRYASGPAHDEKRNIDLKQGERTREIDNRGENRFVDAVTITFGPQRSSSDKATLRVLGLQNAAGAKAARATGPGNVAVAPGPNRPAPSAPGPTGRAGEVYFGHQTLGFARQRDAIKVNGQYGRFKEIRLRSYDNPVFVNDLTVTYTSGASDKINVNAEIPRGQQTQWLTVKSNEFIKDIQINYRAVGGARGQTEVDVYGRFADGWLADAKKANQGWVLIGAQVVNRFVRSEEDEVFVHRDDAGFRRIRIDVRNRAVVLNGLRVVYSNNNQDNYPLKNVRVDADSKYGPIELNAPGKQIIEKLVFKYRNAVLARGGAAVVEIWAHD